MLRRFGARLQRFFFPPPSSSRWRQLLPYITLGILSLAVIKQTTQASHFTQLDPLEVELLKTWIEVGAPDN
jgi:hypothetical protein